LVEVEAALHRSSGGSGEVGLQEIAPLIAMYTLIPLILGVLAFAATRTEEKRLRRLAEQLGFEMDEYESLARATVHGLPVELVVEHPDAACYLLRVAHGREGLGAMASRTGLTVAELVRHDPSSSDPLRRLVAAGGEVRDHETVVPLELGKSREANDHALGSIVLVAASIRREIDSDKELLLDMVRRGAPLRFVEALVDEWSDDREVRRVASERDDLRGAARMKVARLQRSHDMLEALVHDPWETHCARLDALDVLVKRRAFDAELGRQLLARTVAVPIREAALRQVVAGPDGDAALRDALDDPDLGGVAVELAQGARGYRVLDTLRTLVDDDPMHPATVALATHATVDDEARLLRAIDTRSLPRQEPDVALAVLGALRRVATWASVPRLEAISSARNVRYVAPARAAAAGVLARRGPKPTGGISIAAEAGRISADSDVAGGISRASHAAKSVKKSEKS
jgi:hypothetical protein